MFVRRTEAVRWMVRASCHHGFSTLTSVLAIDDFDRFVARTLFPQDVAWAVQLAAVACLSLAAKVEETRVPLLLDLQEVAEAGAANPTTLILAPFLEYMPAAQDPHPPSSFRICRRLDSIGCIRFMCYLRSTLAMAAVLHVLDGGIEYRKWLMSVLNFSDEVSFHELVQEEVSFHHHQNGERWTNIPRKHQA